jgi:hypothetical protein
MTPQHSNTSLANQQFNWNGTDSEELYQKNLVKNRLLLEQYKWIDRPITYKFNSHGFRADEFDSTEPGVMFLGCSHTLGVGLPVESTWAHIVSRSLRLNNYNLGVGGSSNDTAFRLAHHWIEQLKPKLVVLLSAERTRLELQFDNDQIYDLSVWPIGFPIVDNFMKHWYSNDTNSNMNYLKNTLAIKQLCSDRNIKYVQQEALAIPMIDRARDLQHFGEETQCRVADMFLSKL